MTSRHIRASGQAASSQCRARFGRAFAVDDALLALRWADLVRPYGYKLTFLHDFTRADEVIQVHLPPIKKAIANIYQGSSWVWVADCVGQTRPYEDLAAALTSVVPLSRRETHVLLTPRIPPWLWTFRTAAPARNGRVRTLAAALANWAARTLRHRTFFGKG